jgi:glutamate-1-semialdehyde 2,1-aminomutase
MFAFFFAEEPVRNFTDVMASDTDRFSPLFREAMDRGVYLPPSAFETCFISTAHEEGDLDRAMEALTGAIKNI